MVWQDIILTITSILFSVALLPQIIHNFKSKRKTVLSSTSIMQCLAIYAITIVYFTLELYFSTVSAFVNATLWLVLFIQSRIYKKK